MKKEERHLTNKITHVKDVNSSDDEEFIGNSSEGSVNFISFCSTLSYE